jgi:hypothetical protein
LCLLQALGGAGFTNPVKFHAGIDDGIKTFHLHACHRGYRQGLHDITNAPAMDAAHMLMPGNIAIESFGRPCCFKPADLAGIRQEIEVAVYRAEADAGQALTDDAVQLIRCGF